MLLLNESSIHPSCIITMSLVHAYQKTVSKQYIIDYLNLFLGTLMFTNEKIFTRNGFLNPKNNVVWADDRSDANKRGGLHKNIQLVP